MWAGGFLAKPFSSKPQLRPPPLPRKLSMASMNRALHWPQMPCAPQP